VLTVFIVRALFDSFPAAFCIKAKSFFFSVLSLDKATFVPSCELAKSSLFFFLFFAAFFFIIFLANCFICLTLLSIIRAFFLFIDLAKRFFFIIKKEISKKQKSVSLR
jgi:hypothetical protein